MLPSGGGSAIGYLRLLMLSEQAATHYPFLDWRTTLKDLHRLDDGRLRMTSRTPLTPGQKVAVGAAGLLAALGVAAATPAGRRGFNEKVKPLPGRVRARWSRNKNSNVAPDSPMDDTPESDQQ